MHDTSNWRNRIVGEGEEAPDQLMAHPLNWRSHPLKQQEALGEVLDKVGWVDSVIVNRKTGHLVDGHLRVELAKKRGESTIPVQYVDLTEEEERLVLATIDPLAAMAERDDEKLDKLLADLKQQHGGLLEDVGLLGDNAFDLGGLDLHDGELQETEEMKKVTVFVYNSKYRAFMADLKTIAERHGGCKVLSK